MHKEETQRQVVLTDASGKVQKDAMPHAEAAFAESEGFRGKCAPLAGCRLRAGRRPSRSRCTTEDRLLRAMRKFASESFWQSRKHNVLHQGTQQIVNDAQDCLCAADIIRSA